MRRSLFGMAILLSLASVACAKNSSADNMNATIKLNYGQTRTVAHTPLTLTFDAVKQDSRCPEGAQCIRAGDVTVHIEAQAEDHPAEHFDLKLPGAEHARFAGYDITVMDVSPRPTAQGGPPADKDYSVTLSVKK